jgi:hypothetical protein
MPGEGKELQALVRPHLSFSLYIEAETKIEICLNIGIGRNSGAEKCIHYCNMHERKGMVCFVSEFGN